LTGLKKPLWVLAAALGGALLTSCGSGSQAPAGIYGNPPAVEDYLEALTGDYELLPRLFQPERENALSKGEYRGLVETYRRSGLEALPAPDRLSLLAVAEAGFLAHARTLRYSLTAEPSSTGDGTNFHGQALLEEVYGDAEGPFVTARRVRGATVEWRWGLLPNRDATAPNERLDLVTYPADEGQPAVATVWENRAGRWSCITFADTGQSYAWGELVYVRRFAEYAQGELVGPDKVGGRPAYRLTTKGYPSNVDITYWLDAETLWLRLYEYEQAGIRYTVKLDAVNEDITIEPPDVDVECVEERPE
jgi:hypothetical protein